MKKILSLAILLILLAPRPIASRPEAPPVCSNAAARLHYDYTYLFGSADFSDADSDPESGSTYRWLVNGTPTAPAPVAEGLLLHLEDSATGANGEVPALAQNLAYDAGRWGQALALPAGGQLRFARSDNLYLDEGTIEMWVALRAAGDDPVYTDGQTLLHYRAPNGDYLVVAQSGTSGVLYGGGAVNGEWQSAYGSRASMRGWPAGEWHHLAFAYSTAGNWMRFYVDGVLTADTNEGHYWPPAADGTEFAVGGDVWDNAAYYLLDEVRLSGHAASGEEIAAHARRAEQSSANEVWLPTAGLAAGDSVVFEFTPAAAGETGSACQSAPLLYPGIPITNPQPPSTLLPPGATSLELAVQSVESTTCAYAVGTPLPYEQMTPFDQGAGTTVHQTTVSGIDPGPATLNDVYVRCAVHTDYLLALQYRCLSSTNPPFPRTGNLWGWWEFTSAHDLPYLARIDLWLGADSATPEQMRELRELNPDIVILTSINAVENNDIPTTDYYLKDVNGDLIEVWPGSYRLNLTRFDVAEYQAHYAYQSLLDSGLFADGVFFDNVMTTQSWLTHDIYGNPVQIDADEDGLPDDPDVLDAAWKAGVFHEIETFRQLAPSALVNGHSTSIYEPGIADLFNGVSLGFWTANVLEGESPFTELWDLYHEWYRTARQPVQVMFESSPPDQIAYGYDYSPWDHVPASTLEFARTYYPYVRFGLALTLMDDGYFAHEFGDTWHGNDWWYDELDYTLGYPLGPAERVDLDFDPGPNLVANGSFEEPLDGTWDLWANSGAGCQADAVRDTGDAVDGTASARVVVTATSGTDWHIDFHQSDRSLEQGVRYDLTFWAKADRTRPLTLDSQKGSPDWRNYGLWQEVTLSTTWQPYTVTFEAAETVTDARLQFLSGATTGTVWLDDVHLVRHPPDVFQREFTDGLVLLNGTREAQDIPVAPGYRRLVGSQAPLVEYLLDDTAPAFTVTVGTWVTRTYDSGEWQAAGPFYHDWGEGLHELRGAGEARWTLSIPTADTYTITAWWPAAPQAITWTQGARYEVVAGGTVVASATLDQRTAGDEWHLLAAVPLAPADAPFVRLVCSAGERCVADALHVRSLARYNNGAAAGRVLLQPLDGIVLQRAWTVYLPIVFKGY